MLSCLRVQGRVVTGWPSVPVTSQCLGNHLRPTWGQSQTPTGLRIDLTIFLNKEGPQLSWDSKNHFQPGTEPQEEKKHTTFYFYMYINFIYIIIYIIHIYYIYRVERKEKERDTEKERDRETDRQTEVGRKGGRERKGRKTRRIPWRRHRKKSSVKCWPSATL